MKKAAKSLGIIAAILFLIIVVPFFVNFADYAKPYLAQAKQQTGLEVTTGSIKLQILPTPRLVLHDVSVGNKKGAKHLHMLKVKTADVVLSLSSLVVGKVVVDKVLLDNPEINLEKDLNGKGNWEIDFNQSADENSAASPSTTSTNVAAAGLLVKNLYIYNATVTYADAKEKTFKKLENINIEANADAITGPYRINGALQIAGPEFVLRCLAGPFNNGQLSLLANVSSNIGGANLQGEIKGNYNLQSASFAGSFESIITDLPLSFDLPNKKIDLSKKLKVTSLIEANADKINIEDIYLLSDIAQIKGEITYDLNQTRLLGDLNLVTGQDKIHLAFDTADIQNIAYKISSNSYQEFLSWVIADNTYKITQPMAVSGIFVNAATGMQFKQTEISLGKASSKLDFAFVPTTKQLSLKGVIHNVENWGAAFTKPLPLAGDISINVQLIPHNSAFNLKAMLGSHNGNLSFDGIVLDKDSLVNGTLGAKQFNFAGYTFDILGAVNANAQAVNLDLQKLHVKSQTSFDFAAKAKLKVDLSKAKPHISGSIAAQPIQLTAYDASNAPKLMPAIFYQDLVYKLQLTAATAVSRWSRELINPKLDAFTIALHVDVPKVVVAGIALEQLQTTIKLQNAKLTVPVKANLSGGKLEANVQLSNENTFRFMCDVNLNGVNVAGIPAAANHFKKGQAFGKLSVKSFGSSQYELVQNLGGSANFAVKDGIVKGFDLSKMVQLAKKPLNLINPKMLEHTFSGEGETAFKEASADFNIKGGVATTSNLKVDAAEAKLQAAGDIDILNWQLAIKGIVNIPAIKDFPAVGFKIKGPLDRPNYHVDTKALGKVFLQQGGDMVKKVVKGIPGLDQLIPGASNSTEPANSNASHPAKPEKIVKNLIKGIFG